MKILMTGATGLVGRALGKQLAQKNHELVVLTRDPIRAAKNLPFRATLIAWDPAKEPAPESAFAGVEAVIHLAGESVAGGRWSHQKKKEIHDSRILSTRHLVKTINTLKKSSLKTVLFASAIGFYGDRKAEVLEENSSNGSGFLAEVCKSWEEEMTALSTAARVCVLRIGAVLSSQGGALAKLLPVFKSGAASPVGTGEQWMSWIHLEDLVNLFVFCLEEKSVSGVLNAVSPKPVTNRDFSKTLARVLGQRLLPRLPSFLLHLAFGQMASVVLSSQRVLPTQALKAGFSFRYPELPNALASLCSDLARAEEFMSEQWVPAPLPQVFAFFAQATNLETITPPWLHFHILKQSTPEIQQGTLIDYRLKLWGIPFFWQSKIEQLIPNEAFQDIQLKGPYSFWEHTHTFQALQGGTLIVDRVLYRMPLGPLGKLVHALKVAADIAKIFEYRRLKISMLFK